MIRASRTFVVATVDICSVRIPIARVDADQPPHHHCALANYSALTMKTH